MKVSRLCVATTLLVVGLGALLAGSVVAAVKVPDDLTGYWLGSFASIDDPLSPGEAAMSVDSQERQQLKGKLALGRLVFDIQGIVGAEPPNPDIPGARILVRGTIGIADPPDPDRPQTVVIKADYLIVLADGSRDMGSLELVPAVRPR